MNKNDVDVSVVILSFNSLSYIKKCLDSLFVSLNKCSLKGEVYVVENGSSDGSVDTLKKMLDQHPDNLSVIFQTSNTGTTKSRNSALKKVKGKYILILDSDAYMNPETLEGLINYLKINLIGHIFQYIRNYLNHL